MSVTINAGVAYALRNGVASALSDVNSQTTVLRTVCSNGNTTAYSNAATPNRVRNIHFPRHIAKNANWSKLKLSFSNFLATSTNESNSVAAQMRKASIYYNGTFYPVTVGGASEWYVPIGTVEMESDEIAGLSGLSDVNVMVCERIRMPLLYKTRTSPFVVGMVVTGGTSGCTGTVVAMTEGTTGYLVLSGETGTGWTNSEVLTGVLAGYPNGVAAADTTTTQNIPLSIATPDILMGGTLNGTDPSKDYTVALPVTTRASYTAIVTGGSISGSTQVNAGAGYASAVTVWAYETVDGVTYRKTVGSGHYSAGTIDYLTITSGTPPTGLAAWVNPTLVLTGGGDFGNITTAHTATKLTGIPDRPVKSYTAVGDSITKGDPHDPVGDLNCNRGSHERAIANRCGVMNMGISSGQAVYFANLTSTYPKLYALCAGKTTHAGVAFGTNDITLGRTDVQLTANVNTITAYLRGYGTSVDVADLPPRTSGAWTLPDESDQAPTTGFALGEYADLYNARVQSGVIVSDNSYKSMRNLFRGTDPNKWIYLNTDDGTHPNDTGLFRANNDTSFKASFNYLA